MARRALTLLELLLALSLLLALGAIVLPVAVESLRERAFEANTEIIRNQLLLARAHAGASGRPVEVLYEPAPPRIEARYFQVDVAGDRPEDVRAPRRRAAGARPEAEAPGGAAGEPESGLPGGPPDPIVESWARNLLPEGFSVADQPPEAPPTGVAAADLDTPPRPLRLALFMPDGSAILSRPVWLGDDHGRQAKLTFNPWTGLPSHERLPAGGEAGSGPPAEGDQP